MKQGINNRMLIDIDTNLDLCDSIEFRFKQRDVVKDFMYPSDQAERVDDHTISLFWTKEDKALFRVGDIYMDTRIELLDSDDQPETEVVKVYMSPSLFE